MKKCVIIYNPASGRKNKSKIIKQFEKILLDYNYETEVYFTKYRKHATEIVKDLEHVDLVLAMGGDGTFNEVINGNYLRKDKLLCALIPSGTTNDIGSMLGYGKNAIDNLKMTLNGEVKKFDICLINDIPFVYVAAFGKFSNIPYITPRDLKKKIGYMAYIIEAVKSFFNKTKLEEIIYEVDGVEYRGFFSFVIVSSANRISGINDFYKDVKLDDNKFEILLCNITKKNDILKSLYLLAKYDVYKVPGIYAYKASNFKIKFVDKPQENWCIDGEELNKTDYKYNITINNEMKLLVPKKNINKLFVDNK